MDVIKKIGCSIREFKKASILAPVFVIGEVFMEVLIPYLMALMIDNGFSQDNRAYVFKIGGIMLICAIIGLFFGVMSGRYAAIASTGLARNLREDLYHHIQTFSFSNIDKFSAASLVTRQTTDVTNVQNAFQMIIRMLVRAPIMMIFSMIMAFIINVQLSLIFLLAIPFLAICVAVISFKAHGFFTKLFKVYDRMNTVVQENLVGIRTVKAYVREEEEVEKFKETSKGMQFYSVAAEKLLILNNPIMFFAVYVCMLVCSYFGANMIIVGKLQTGELMSLFSYTLQILSSLMMVSMVIIQCVMAKASADRIIEVLEEDSDLSNKPEFVKEVKDGSIEFDHVSFGYGGGKDKYVLRDINIKIESGQTIGILGGTGSSKTSMVSLISRLYDVSEGSVKVGGVDVRDYGLKELRDQVAVVLQKNELFSGTIAENLRWGDENATDEQIVEACEISQAKEFIDQMPDGYDTYIEQGGRNVSGGQKQRLCIARALLKHPKILILDDSTSAVDMATDAKIQQGFKNYIPETTKLIIAQRVASVEAADKIIVLNEGEISGIGTHEELLASNEIYRDVYESQKKGGEE
jgi:ATP-binding cassette, subfamily B, multidrug efflux pump